MLRWLHGHIKVFVAVLFKELDNRAITPFDGLDQLLGPVSIGLDQTTVTRVEDQGAILPRNDLALDPQLS